MKRSGIYIYIYIYNTTNTNKYFTITKFQKIKTALQSNLYPRKLNIM